MEPVATSLTAGARVEREANVACGRGEQAPAGPPPRRVRAPGMGFQHELLLALIMALAMTATVFLYR